MNSLLSLGPGLTQRLAVVQVNTEMEEMRALADELGVTGLPFFNIHSACDDHIAVQTPPPPPPALLFVCDSAFSPCIPCRRLRTIQHRQFWRPWSLTDAIGLIHSWVTRHPSKPAWASWPHSHCTS